MNIVERLKTEDFNFSSRASTGRFHLLAMDAAAEIERLRLWIRRIDNINDDPSCFSTEIDRACIDALAGKPMVGKITINQQLTRDPK